MKAIRIKITAIVIIYSLLMISACQTTSKKVSDKESDKKSGITEENLPKPQSSSRYKDVSEQLQKEEKADSSEVLKKRDIRRSGDNITPKKQIEAPPVKISDSMRNQMIQDARQATKEQRYIDVVQIANAILRDRPGDEAALALRENALALQEDLRHKKVMAQIEKVDTSERNKYFENLREKSIPYNDLMQYTDEDKWEDIKGRTLREDPERRLEENLDHTERLRQTPSPSQKPTTQEMQMKLGDRLSIEFINTPLRDIISFLQEKSKMNIFLDKDVPDTNVNIKLNDVPLSVILDYILPKGLGYVVKDNIIHIDRKSV